MAKQAVRQVSIFINGKEVENTIKSIAAEQKKLSNGLKLMTVGTEEYEAAVKDLRGLNSIITEHNQKLKGVQQGWSLTKVGIDKFVGVAAGAFAVDSLLTYGKQLYGAGVAMDTLQRKAQVVFGSSLPQVTAEAEKNAAAIGLTTAQYVSAAAAIQDLLIPMGFQRKEAADISTQLVNLSGALSEWTGGQIKADEVSKILTKALLGEREELKQLGISISDADVKAQLAAKGLDKLTGAALEQAKAASTLELVLAKSTDAQEAFAKNGDSAVRRQAETMAKFQIIIENLSRALLPVFEALTNIALGVGNALNYMSNESARTTKAQKTLADQTKDLQAEFNSEIEVLVRGNFSQEERARIIKDINSKYAEYLPNLLSEKSSIEQIRIAQEAANKEFAKKILYVAFQERIAKETKKAADAAEDAFQSEKNRQELLQQDASNLDSENANKALENQIGLAKTLRDINLKVVKDSPAQIKKVQDGYAGLAETLGTTLAELDKKFGTKEGAKGTGGAGGDKAIKEAEDLQKELTALIERTTALRLDLIAKEQDDALAITIRGIEKRYEGEIAKAIELEKKGVTAATAQRIALEKLKQEEIGLAVKEGVEKDILDAEEAARKKQDAELKIYEETLQFLDDKKKEREEMEAEIKAFQEENLLTEQQQTLLRLEEHYATLLSYAQKNGIDTLELTKAYEVAKTNVVKDQNKERIESEKALVAAQTELAITKANALAEGASILSGFFEESSVIAKSLFLVEKAASAVSVILSLQKEKAAIYASTRLGTIFDPTGAVGLALAAPQIAAANIRGGINLGIIAATAIKPFIKQKAEGGYLSVTGDTDQQTYNAKVISTPSTGLLPHYPTLFQSNATNQPVLASERGAEYFVASHDLRNPYVANLVRMIDLATHGGRGVAQFEDGGVNATTSSTAAATTAPAADQSVMRELTVAINTLNALLSRGIIAVVPDGTVLDINQRLGKLKDISGGYF